MAKSTRPRKHYAQRKATDRLALRAAQGSFLMTVQGLAHKGQIWVLNRERIPNELWGKKPYRRAFDLSFMTPRKWHLTSGVACRDQAGKFYVKYFSQQANNEFVYFHPEIQEWMMQELADIVNDVNKDHIITPFTIANSNAHKFTEAQIIDLMHWLKVDDPTLLQSNWEMQHCVARAKQEIATHTFEQYLDPITASVLRKGGIHDWLDIYERGESEIRALKGIGDKRMTAIYEAILLLATDPTLRETLPTFQAYALNLSRRSCAVEFLEQRTAAAQAMYETYLEGKRNGKYP